MKTIINITLGGRSVAIEDSAFEKIKAYTESLRQYYRNEEGRDEIVADIEGRFSELMHEKIRKGATHITETDVDEMINSMGRPEDFDNQETTGEKKAHTSQNFNFQEKRRLYRDESDKIIGGVCSGIANWLNIDPTVVRILFAIISFGGFGSGFLLYILLWIFLPAKNMNVYKGKRMFRNPDNKIIGGVAGGMGAYFNINPTTIRWILAIPLILSALKGIHFFGWNDDFNFFPNLLFGGLSGTFVFVYIVLWIVLPEATTPYQKMEMHGKTVDVNTIRENVQNSMGDVKDKIQSWSHEVRQAGERVGERVNTFAQKRGPEFGREFRYAAARGGKGAGYVIGMFFKVVFLMLAAIIVIPLFIMFLAFLFSGIAWAPINNFLWTNDNQQMWAWGTLLFFIGAPIVGLMVSLIRTILKVRTPGNYLNWLFGGLWFIGWICLMIFISSMAKDFRRTESANTPLNIQQPSNGKMVLTVNQPQLEYRNDFYWGTGNNDLYGFDISPDTLKISSVGVEFDKSPDSLFHVLIEKEAYGKTEEDATGRLQKIQYTVTSSDSVLELANGFSIDRNSKYRLQHVTVQVQIPVGKKIRIDPSVKSKLSGDKIHISNHREWRRRKSDRKPLANYRSDVDYTMDSTGKLVSADAKEVIDTENKEENYRWEDNIIDSRTPPAAPVPPVAPEAPVAPANPTDSIYRFDATPAPAPSPANNTKEQLRKELEQKQKELDELKKRLEQ